MIFKMKEIYSLIMVQKQGTISQETPLLALDPSIKESVEHIMGQIDIAIDKMGIYGGQGIRKKLFKFVESCHNISEFPENKIYIDEHISFKIDPIYVLEANDDISILKSFKDSIEQ
jgi:hypothetical protein